MDVLTQIIVSGLTLGAMYAISTVGLSLVYGSLNMLNMAHGGILTIGGYSAYAVSQQLGWPPAFGFVAALVVGAAIGLLIFVATAWPLLSSKSFETNIFIATIGVGAVFENIVLKLFGPYREAAAAQHCRWNQGRRCPGSLPEHLDSGRRRRDDDAWLLCCCNAAAPAARSAPRHRTATPPS